MGKKNLSANNNNWGKEYKLCTEMVPICEFYTASEDNAEQNSMGWEVSVPHFFEGCVSDYL